MNRIYWVVIFVLVVFAAAYGISFYGSSSVVVSDPDLDNFAKCLADKKATMYGAYWCSHCQNEKNNFGESFKYVNYVECTKDIKICTEKGVTGYPTWEFSDGTRSEGEQGLAKLSEKTGCLLKIATTTSE